MRRKEIDLRCLKSNRRNGSWAKNGRGKIKVKEVRRKKIADSRELPD